MFSGCGCACCLRPIRYGSQRLISGRSPFGPSRQAARSRGSQELGGDRKSLANPQIGAFDRKLTSPSAAAMSAFCQGVKGEGGVERYAATLTTMLLLYQKASPPKLTVMLFAVREELTVERLARFRFRRDRASNGIASETLADTAARAVYQAVRKNCDGREICAPTFSIADCQATPSGRRSTRHTQARRHVVSGAGAFQSWRPR